MKMKALTKNKLLTGVVFASLITCGGAFAMESENDIFMPETMVNTQADTPFMEIDVEATINQLSEQDRIEAQTLFKDIQAIYGSMPEEDENVFETGLSADAENQLIEKEERLDSILQNSKTDPVMTNLLDDLSPEKRARAEQLWKEIQSSDQQIEAKYDELDAILLTVKK